MQTNLLNQQSINPSAMYRARDCARFYSIGLSTWWNWTKTGKAKRGTKLGPKTTVWEGAYLLELKQKLINEAECC
ncbi:helix-turn-helix transcriptional regulator [Microbulbifer sp. TRSA005]|uniref:helix-turn-helix transcriptional regulator n=1 Tax=Microbulbifer sp. TRSA005 TaxID=3243383 RepID=UPI00403A5F7A